MFTWSTEATILIWEQEAIWARNCWVSGSRKPVPSILWIRTHTKESCSSDGDPSRKANMSSVDLELNGWSTLDKLPVVFLLISIWSQKSSATAIRTCTDPLQTAHAHICKAMKGSKMHIHILLSREHLKEHQNGRNFSLRGTLCYDLIFGDNGLRRGN